MGSIDRPAKRFAEAMVMAYHRVHGLDTRMVRIFNTYGPRMRLEDGRAIPAFLGQALRDEEVTVFGDGSQTRSLCYISDLVEGIHRLAASDVAEPVNIGNPREMTIRELAETIIALTGSKSRIVLRPLPVDDPKVRQPTSRGPGTSWGGSRGSRSPRAFRGRWTTSRRDSASAEILHQLR